MGGNQTSFCYTVNQKTQIGVEGNVSQNASALSSAGLSNHDHYLVGKLISDFTR